MGIAHDIGIRMNDSLPELGPAVERCEVSLRFFVHQFIGSDTPGEALAAITTQSVNDFVDLMYDISCGRGRLALRSSRSLFELLATFNLVSGSDEEAERYLAHLVVADYWQSKMDQPERALGGDEKRAVSYRRMKLAKRSKKDL